jgi:hypothetical protein
MKATLLRLGALSLSCTALVAPSSASAQAGDPIPDIVDFCQDLTENFPELDWTPGTCLASLIASAPALDNFVCMSWERDGLLEFFGFKNMGDCVKSGLAQP